MPPAPTLFHARIEGGSRSIEAGSSSTRLGLDIVISLVVRALGADPAEDLEHLGRILEHGRLARLHDLGMAGHAPRCEGVAGKAEQDGDGRRCAA